MARWFLVPLLLAVPRAAAQQAPPVAAHDAVSPIVDVINYGAELHAAKYGMDEYLRRIPEQGSLTEAEVLQGQLDSTDPSLPERFKQWHRDHFIHPDYLQSYDSATNMPAMGVPPVEGVAGKPRPDFLAPAAASDWTPVRLPGGINSEYYLSFMHDYNRYPANARASLGAPGFLRYLQRPWFQVPMAYPHAPYLGAGHLAPQGAPYGHPGVLPGARVGHFAPSVHAALGGLHGARFAAAPPAGSAPSAGGSAQQQNAPKSGGGAAPAHAPPSAYRVKRAALEAYAGEEEARLHALAAMASAGLDASLGFGIHGHSDHHDDDISALAFAAALAAHQRDLRAHAQSTAALYADEQRQFTEDAVDSPSWSLDDFRTFTDGAASQGFAKPPQEGVDGLESGGDGSAPASPSIGAVQRMLQQNEAEANQE